LPFRLSPSRTEFGLVLANRPNYLSGLDRPPNFHSGKAYALPPRDGFRLNHAGHPAQVRPKPDHQNQQRQDITAQSKMRRHTPQNDAELRTKKKVLNFKRHGN
jgi:hypothetical protein